MVYFGFQTYTCPPAVDPTSTPTLTGWQWILQGIATKSQDELMEMKQRLGKMEDTIKEIVLEAKKPIPSKTQGDQSTKLPPIQESKPSNVHKPGETNKCGFS
ncbi:Uncharacterized protein Rs2_39386 [Raphanus sativus]|nr:Uncharacterized protein Rs2_39386 [Raphanus sativus]